VKSIVSSAVVLLGYAIILFLLVRPGSQGPTLVGNVSNGVSGIIKGATGGGTWAQS